VVNKMRIFSTIPKQPLNLALSLTLLILSTNNHIAAVAEALKTNDAKPAASAIKLSDGDWKKKLTPAQYQVLRAKGTEPPYSGKYNDFYGKGTYKCAACGNTLFSSVTKFDAHEGWPSFYAPVAPSAISKLSDNSLMMMPRTEVECSKCGSHLGHVFDDGPKPTGLRYCINSVCLNFDAAPAK
jgi:peptide-methionine (R)-S-oxide reductase